MGRRAGVLLAALCLADAASLAAQDSTAAPRRLAIDSARLAPAFRVYDMLVSDADSVVLIGTRTVAMLPGAFAETPGWRIVENRTGAVPAADTLWLAADARPLYWSATLGPGRLTAQFANDTLFGMVAIGRVQRNIVLPVPPNVLVTTAMAAIVVGVLPVGDAWADSATVLEIDPTGARAISAEIVAVARETVSDMFGAPRDLLVVALRTPSRQILFWLDADTRAPVKIRQQLSPAGDRHMEYRLREIPPLRLPLYWP